jgi:RNA 2',3'-cyclic 3'-phosphodiesterase
LGIDANMPRTRYIPGQLTLDTVDDTPEAIDNVFFALQPDGELSARIAALSQELKARYKLAARPIAPERLHLSLFHVGTWLGLRQDVVREARNVAASLREPTFRVAFDKVVSFAGKPGNRPLVLTADETDDSASGTVAVKAFYRTMTDAMLRAGINKGVNGKFTPHVTLMYDGHKIVEPIDDEIAWTVREFVLIHSFVGLSKYEILGRWPLEP